MLELKWQSVDQRRDFFTASLMHKCLTNKAPVHLRNRISFVSENHNVRTRFSQNANVTTPRPNVEKFKKSFSYHGPQLWNALPSEIRSAGTQNEMKYLYKQTFF